MLLKIPLYPGGKFWIWKHFVDHIVEPLRESGLLKIEEASTKHRTSRMAVLQDGVWRREDTGRKSYLMLAEFAQELGMPMTMEERKAAVRHKKVDFDMS
jgi:hypothetical protein